jgi:hypothetical protein
MQREQITLRALRRRLLARASVLALRVALRPRGWAPGLLAMGLISAQAPALAQQTIDLATEADLTIQGAAANDRSGFSVSGAGDVNGDGIDDLIIGAHYAYGLSGASYVVFGADEGFPATIDLASDADLIIQGVAGAYERSGHSVSGAGDVNGDGIDDLIIGALRADPNGRENAGVSYVVFGSDQGLPATIDLATDADLVIQGAAYDLSGASVSGAGDVDGDGVDDLLIGAPGAASGAGASYVVFGTDQGFPATIDLASDADVTIQGVAPGDSSGGSVRGAGDVNGDGLDDLLIGAEGVDPNGRYDAGASYVVFGAVDLSGTIDLATDADLIIEGAATGDHSGHSVSGAGDVDGDGIDDLITGAWSADPNGRENAGASYVVFGAVDLSGTIDLATDADLVIQGAAADDRSGYSVSGAGDVNGDGLDDLLIGAEGVDPNGRYDAGASYVVFGTDQGFPATIDLASDADLIIQGAVAIRFGGDISSISVSGAGDINGDDIDDLLIGAPYADVNGYARETAGTSYVVFGTAADPVAAIEDLIADVEAAGLPDGLENSLTKKLSNAQGSLARGQIKAAIGKIQAFINQVRAQRGKKIDEADADAWIADAEAIIDALKAQRDHHRGPRHDAPSPMVEAQQ